MSKLKAEAARLSQINWRSDPARVDIHTILFREYVRRQQLWARALGRNDRIRPFFFANVENPEGDALWEQYSTVPETDAITFQTRMACQSHLQWASAFDHAIPLCRNLPAPYEPLIKMFERGGDLMLEHTLVELGSRTRIVDVSGWRAWELEEQLIDDASLTSLEARPSPADWSPMTVLDRAKRVAP